MGLEGAGPDTFSVAAVVVLFRPDPTELAATLAAIAPQVERVVLVENGPGSEFPSALASALPRRDLVRLEANRGLAAGQNAGIARAAAAGATHVLLLDQDSEPAPDMVVRLCAAAARLEARGVQVGALGPAWVDPRTGVPGPLPRFAWPWERPAPVDPGVDEVDGLISSGSLIALRTLGTVGPFDEGLFVYHVDTDWVLRARCEGLRVFQVRDAAMRHRIGEGLVRWWFAGRRVGILYRPRPWYFIFRNGLLVRRKGFAPLSWRLRELVRMPVLALFALLWSSQPRATLAMILRGIADGIRGRTGPAPFGDDP